MVTYEGPYFFAEYDGPYLNSDFKFLCDKKRKGIHSHMT